MQRNDGDVKRELSVTVLNKPLNVIAKWCILIPGNADFNYWQHVSTVMSSIVDVNKNTCQERCL